MFKFRLEKLLLGLCTLPLLAALNGCGDSDTDRGDLVIRLSDRVKLAMVKVEAGSFTMGDDGKNLPCAPRKVTLTRDFYLARTEVTQRQWNAVMSVNPSFFRASHNRLPVDRVSWEQAMIFCEMLNQKGLAPEGWRFTLPTEAQWEYAARGGRKSRGCRYAGSSDLSRVAWFGGNSRGRTRQVGRKRPNELGLFDMAGNVSEWCLDVFEMNYARDPEFLVGNDSVTREHFTRGGNYTSGAGRCRAAYRYRASNAKGKGFRPALVMAAPPPSE